MDSRTGEPIEEVVSDVPDFVTLTASLAPSLSAPPVTVRGGSGGSYKHDEINKDAILLATWRRGASFPGTEEPALSWVIDGERGSVRLTAAEWPHMNVGGGGGDDGFVIKVFDKTVVDGQKDQEQKNDDRVERVEWGWEEWQEELPIPARNIGALYEALAEDILRSSDGTGSRGGEGELKVGGGETNDIADKRYTTFEEGLKRQEELGAMLAALGQ